MSWQDLLGKLSGYRQLYLKEVDNSTYLRGVLVPPKCVSVEERDLTWLAEIMDAQLHHDGILWRPMDNVYFIPSWEDTVQVVLPWCRNYPLPPGLSTQVFNCEDRAVQIWARSALWGVNHIGIVNDFSSEHAYNIFLTPEGELWIYSPKDELLWGVKGQPAQLPHFKLEWADIWL